jgi:subtilisin family serine protease
MSGFSNNGRCVDIMAPGEAILSTYSSADNAAAYMSGTSMAAPHVAGVKALWLSKRNQGPEILDAILRESAGKNMIDGLPKSTINYMLYNNPPRSFAEMSMIDDGDDDDDQTDAPEERPDQPEETDDDDQTGELPHGFTNEQDEVIASILHLKLKTFAQETMQALQKMMDA